MERKREMRIRVKFEVVEEVTQEKLREFYRADTLEEAVKTLERELRRDLAAIFEPEEVVEFSVTGEE